LQTPLWVLVLHARMEAIPAAVKPIALPALLLVGQMHLELLVLGVGLDSTLMEQAARHVLLVSTLQMEFKLSALLVLLELSSTLRLQLVLVVWMAISLVPHKHTAPRVLLQLGLTLDILLAVDAFLDITSTTRKELACSVQVEATILHLELKLHVPHVLLDSGQVAPSLLVDSVQLDITTIL
jgi:hypothetical protein